MRSKYETIIINLSKNYGHEAAMLAGIDSAHGDLIICLDADLQHPPEKIKDIIEAYEEGYHIINMVRIEDTLKKKRKNLSSKLFYYIINKISDFKFTNNASDFFAISKEVAYHIRVNFRERNRFLRGYIQIIGFNKTQINFIAPERVAGNSKYNFKKLFKFATNSIFTFSQVPLILAFYLSFLCGAIGLLIAIDTVHSYIMNNTPPGYSTLIILFVMMFSINFAILGIIGKYVGLIFDEIKQRPIYIIESIEGEQE